MPPETRYAKNGQLHIAYQMAGEGPLDVVFVSGWISHVEHMWEEPAFARFLRRLASFSRLILIDKRGTGLSDPVTRPPTVEERMEDVRAVMDVVGSERAALLGVSEGGAMNLLFAATHPGRTTALVLLGAYARLAWAPDYPWGWPAEGIEAFLAQVEQGWGTGVAFDVLAPGYVRDQRLQQWWARYQRLAASPGAAMTLMRMAYEIDVRFILPAVRVPTLVLHRADDRLLSADHGRYLAQHIAGAKYVELPGADHLFFLGEADAVLDEIEEFLTGVRVGGQPDRVLATVLFTDVVGSTERAAALGDRLWRDLLEDYRALVRRQLARFRGREVDAAGDGVLAAFDGPGRAVECARAIGTAARQLDIDIRAGVHTGECELMGERLSGIALHIGARVAALAAGGEVLVSSTVRDLVAGSGLLFEDRGSHALKGIPGEWRLFSVVRPSTG